MPYIKVNTNKISMYSSDINSIYTRVNRIKSEFSSIGYSLDWDIKSASGINNRIRTIENELNAQYSGLSRMKSFLSSTTSKYNNVENSINNDKKRRNIQSAQISKSAVSVKFSNDVIRIFGDIGNAVQKKASDVKSKLVNVTKNVYKNVSEATKNAATLIHGAYDRVIGGIKTSINYIAENYQNKGWVYKTVQYGKATVKAAGGVAKIGVGLASIFASGGLSTPAAVLTCLSGVNDLINFGYNLAAIHENDYDSVGNFNALKDGLSWIGGKVGDVFGNEKVGSNIGKGIYYASEAYVGIENLCLAWNKVKQIDKISIAKLGQELKELGNTKIDVWKILNTDISQLKLDYALAKYEFKTIADASKNLSVMTACVSKLASVVKKANQTYSAITDTENWIGSAFDTYDNATEYKGYTYGGIKSKLESIIKNYKIITGLR